jgi:hypothetical protein
MLALIGILLAVASLVITAYPLALLASAVILLGVAKFVP